MKKTFFIMPALLAGFTAFAQVETPVLSPEESAEIVEEVEEIIEGQVEEGQEVIIGTPQVVRETVIEEVVTPVMEEPVVFDDEEELVEEEEVYSAPTSSIDDIINMQQRLTASMSEEKHFESVWGRKGYFNISYNMASLEPKAGEMIPTGIGNGFVDKYKSDWGLGLQYGRNYNILKKAIVNIVMINIDYTPLDLNANHYKKEDKTPLYPINKNSEGNYYYPWNTEKYEFNYGMNVGPSITLAPFTKINGLRGLHFLKFNVYYHIGYHISLLLNKINKDDAAKEAQDYSQSTFDTYNKVNKLCFGHGLTNAVGFNVSWKSIGVGYEVRWANLQYQTIDSQNFGKDKYKFNAPTNRVYLNIRL